MEYKRFIQLMNEPGDVESETMSSLQELVNEFPYFQSAHLLLARSMKEQEHIRYERQLKLASAYAPDRKVLFSLIHDKKNKKDHAIQNAKEQTPSPFILVDEKEIDVAEQELSRDALINNPFIEPNLPVPQAIQEEIISSEVSETQIANEPSFKPIIPEPVKEVFPELTESINHPVNATIEGVSTDPREILKRRLSEILGNTEKEAPQAIEKSEEKIIPQGVSKIAESEIVQEITEPIEPKNFADPLAIPEIPSDNILETLSSIPEPVIPEPPTPDRLADLLPEDSGKPLDTIEKLELEYAMEETLLGSLENLPIMEGIKKHEEVPVKMPLNDEHPEVIPEKAQEDTQDSPRSFTSWLQKLSGKEFGHVEIVHADDEPDRSQVSSQSATNIFQQAETDVAKAIIKSDPFLIAKTDEKPKSHEDDGISRQKKELIDKFIATEPKIVPSKIEFYSPVTQAKRSLEEYDDVVSETLAGIYRQQGNNLKARFCYEKLSLYYPEKRTYFAALIKEIDEELNRSNQEDL